MIEYRLPILARKLSVSLDWLVWLCSETPVRKPCAARRSHHRYEMVELAILPPPTSRLPLDSSSSVSYGAHKCQMKTRRMHLQFPQGIKTINRTPKKTTNAKIRPGRAFCVPKRENFRAEIGPSL